MDKNRSIKEMLDEKVRQMEESETESELRANYRECCSILKTLHERKKYLLKRNVKKIMPGADSPQKMKKTIEANESPVCKEEVPEEKEEILNSGMKEPGNAAISSNETKKEDEVPECEAEKGGADKNKEENEEASQYALFYSKNNAAYVSLDTKLGACVPVRNMAKAFCVRANVMDIASAKNLLSRYNLNKLKPIEIKFISQEEYDNTIGRVKSMQEIMNMMPQSDNKTVEVAKGTKNFAGSGSKSGGTHIRGKVKKGSTGSYKPYNASSYYPKSASYNKNASYNGSRPNAKSYTPRERLENPHALYYEMHFKGKESIDEEEITGLASSYRNDCAVIDDMRWKRLEDCDTVVDLLTETLTKIGATKSGWLISPFVGDRTIINNDYLINIDYKQMGDAICEWNRKNSPFCVEYVEEFDPTFLGFKTNIINAAKRYVKEERELAAEAVYNYLRCLIAYEEWTAGNEGAEGRCGCNENQSVL